MCGAGRGQTYKDCENGYALYYSPAGTLWEKYKSIMYYRTRSVNNKFNLLSWTWPSVPQICQNQRLKMLTCPVTQFHGLGEVNFYRDFFWTNKWNQIFSKQEPPSNTNVDHWMALEISFREDLDIFLCEFNPKLKHKTIFAKHTVVKSFQRLILFESYTMSKLLYTLNLLSKINTKRGLHSHTNL